MKILEFILLLSLSCPLFADGFVASHFGISWPGTLSELPKSSDHILYDVGVDWGGSRSFIGFMGRCNVIVKGTNEYLTLSKQSTQKGGEFETVKALSTIRRRIFSLGAGILVNPISKYTVHPILKASFEPTVMLLLNDDDKLSDDIETLPPTGAYRGAIKRIELELHTRLQEDLTLFVSAGYQFGYLKKRINFEFFQEEREYIRQSMNGISLRVGFQFR